MTPLFPVGALKGATLLLAACTAAAAHAGALTVHVTDNAGKPLVDAVALLEPVGAKVAVKPLADVEISQAKREFNPRVTLITVGTRATFPNFDTVRHHVYSFSPNKTFELKLYAGVPNMPVVFDKPGIAVLGCNIHDNMAAWVVVADTPWFARSAAGGRARIESLPAGAYRLRLWHPGMSGMPEPTVTALTMGAGDADHHAKLNVSAEP